MEFAGMRILAEQWRIGCLEFAPSRQCLRQSLLSRQLVQQLQRQPINLITNDDCTFIVFRTDPLQACLQARPFKVMSA